MNLRGGWWAVAAGMAWLMTGPCATAQQAIDSPGEAAPVLPAPVASPVSVPLNEERIFKVIPDYQTVQDSSRPVAPLTAKQKWNLGLKEAVDPFNIASAAMTAA